MLLAGPPGWIFGCNCLWRPVYGWLAAFLRHYRHPREALSVCVPQLGLPLPRMCAHQACFPGYRPEKGRCSLPVLFWQPGWLFAPWRPLPAPALPVVVFVEKRFPISGAFPRRPLRFPARALLPLVPVACCFCFLKATIPGKKNNRPGWPITKRRQSR